MRREDLFGDSTFNPLRKRRYSLAELMAQCDASVPPSAEDIAWLDAPPIGRDTI
jgi:hypothetical protein